MPLNWHDIQTRAVHFSREWSSAEKESAKKERDEAQTFWNEFFDVFGVRRRTVASFEEKVRSIKGRFGFIDLFWQGKMPL